MEIREVVPRVWGVLEEFHVSQVGTQGMTIRMNPRDWQDLRMEAKQLLAKNIPVIEGDSMLGVPVVVDFWVPVGKLFICREVEA